MISLVTYAYIYIIVFFHWLISKINNFKKRKTKDNNTFM